MARSSATRAVTRREFTVDSVLALLAGVTITLTGCGGSTTPTSPSSTGGSTQAGDFSGTISANHGHIATVTAAQITANQAVTLDIRGTADHTHTVSLSATDIHSIGTHQRVSVVSSNDNNHTHTVTFN